MTDLKISQFTDGGPVEETDEIAAVRGGINTKVFVGSMAAEDAADYTPTDDLGTAAFADIGDYTPTASLGDLAFLDQVTVSDIDATGAPSSTTFLRGDGSWSATGDVTGPASSVDNAIVRFDGTTGKIIQDYTSGAPTISDTGVVTIPQGVIFGSGGSNLNYFTNATSFTPAMAGTTTAGTGTYSVQRGWYFRFGDVVCINARCDWSAHTGTGNLIMTGLPFTSASGSDAGCIIYSNNLGLGSNNYGAANILSGASIVTLYGLPLAGGAVALVGMDTSASVIITGFYRV